MLHSWHAVPHGHQPPWSTWAELPFYFGICALGFLNWGLQKLVTAIYADYARSLKSLGFKQGAVHFASKAGVAGRELLYELGSPKEELTEGWHVVGRKSGVGSKVWGALAWLLTVAVKVSPDWCEDLALVSCFTTFLMLQVSAALEPGLCPVWAQNSGDPQWESV